MRSQLSAMSILKLPMADWSFSRLEAGLRPMRGLKRDQTREHRDARACVDAEPPAWSATATLLP
jgi:hypothetical protein